MTKEEVASALEEIGVLLELKGETGFRTLAYYNAARPHQALAQQTPLLRPISTAAGPVRCRPILGGIQNDYYRDAA